MLTTYLRSTLRSFQHNVQSSIINLVGLSLGIAVFILIAEFVTLEYAYDSSYEKSDRLHRLIFVKGDDYSTFVSPGSAPLLQNQVTGVTSYCRIAEGQNLGSGIIQLENGESFREQNFAYVDGTFFNFFSFPISEGDGKGLTKPYTVALSTEVATRLFNNKDVIGKRIKLNNQFGKAEYTVVAVFDQSAHKTNLKYNLLFALETLQNPANLNGNDGWASLDGVQSRWLNCFLLVDSGADTESLSQNMRDALKKLNPQEPDASLELQAITNMNLGRSVGETHPTYSSLATVYTMVVIALLILCIALFNYVNLTTADSLKRAKEVGLRKISGASRLELVNFFMFQSVMYCSVAVMISLAIVNLVQQPVNYIIGTQLNLSLLISNNFGLIALFTFLLLCVMAGAYVGLSLSSFQPITMLRGSFARSQRGTMVRKSLIVFQFSVTASLITLTVVLFLQSQFMLSKDLGMQVSQLITVKGPDVGDEAALQDGMKRFDDEMASFSYVSNITRSGNAPFRGFNFSTSGITIRNTGAESKNINFNILTTDHRYHLTYGIDILAGRPFYESEGIPGWNQKRVVMINNTAAQVLGVASPVDAVGKFIHWGERELEIIGVVADYHHLPVQSLITPVIFIPAQSGNYITFKVDRNNSEAFVNSLETVFHKNFPANPLDFNFLSDSVEVAYQKERNYTMLSAAISLLAIGIALMGIFGLVTFMIEQRIKEVGIRRIVGASTSQITTLFTKEFVNLILISSIISIPVSIALVQKWLEGFAYKVDLNWLPYIIGPSVGLLLSLLIVMKKVNYSARIEAVKLLRHE